MNGGGFFKKKDTGNKNGQALGIMRQSGGLFAMAKSTLTESLQPSIQVQQATNLPDRIESNLSHRIESNQSDQIQPILSSQQHYSGMLSQSSPSLSHATLRKPKQTGQPQYLQQQHLKQQQQQQQQKQAQKQSQQQLQGQNSITKTLKQNKPTLYSAPLSPKTPTSTPSNFSKSSKSSATSAHSTPPENSGQVAVVRRLASASSMESAGSNTSMVSADLSQTNANPFVAVSSVKHRRQGNSENNGIAGALVIAGKVPNRSEFSSTSLNDDDGTGIDLVVLAARQMSSKSERQNAKLQEMVLSAELETTKQEYLELVDISRDLENQLSKMTAICGTTKADVEVVQKEIGRFAIVVKTLEKYKKETELREMNYLASTEKLQTEMFALRNAEETWKNQAECDKKCLTEIRAQLNFSTIENATLQTNLTHTQKLVEIKLGDIKQLRDSLASHILKSEQIIAEKTEAITAITKQHDTLEYQLSSLNATYKALQEHTAAAAASHAAALMSQSSVHSQETAGLLQTHSLALSALQTRNCELNDSMRADWTAERTTLRSERDAVKAEGEIRLAAEVVSRDERIARLFDEVIAVRHEKDAAAAEVREIERKCGKVQSVVVGLERDLQAAKEKVLVLEREVEREKEIGRREVENIMGERDGAFMKYKEMEQSKIDAEARLVQTLDQVSALQTSLGSKEFETNGLNREREQLDISVELLKSELQNSEKQLADNIHECELKVRRLEADNQQILQNQEAKYRANVSLIETKYIDEFAFAKEASEKESLDKSNEQKISFEIQLSKLRERSIKAVDEIEIRYKSLIQERDSQDSIKAIENDSKQNFLEQKLKNFEDACFRLKEDHESAIAIMEREQKSSLDILNGKVEAYSKENEQKNRIIDNLRTSIMENESVIEILRMNSGTAQDQFTSSAALQASFNTKHEHKIIELNLELNEKKTSLDAANQKFNDFTSRELENSKLLSSLQNDLISKDRKLSDQKKKHDDEMRAAVSRLHTSNTTTIIEINRIQDEKIAAKNAEFDKKYTECKQETSKLATTITELTKQLQEHKDKENVRQKKNLEVEQQRRSQSQTVDQESPRRVMSNTENSRVELDTSSSTVSASRKSSKALQQSITNRSTPNTKLTTNLTNDSARKKLRFESETPIANQENADNIINDEIIDEPVSIQSRNSKRKLVPSSVNEKFVNRVASNPSNARSNRPSQVTQVVSSSKSGTSVIRSYTNRNLSKGVSAQPQIEESHVGSVYPKLSRRVTMKKSGRSYVIEDIEEQEDVTVDDFGFNF
ncbi:hypothetical protein HK100_000415 [Physocladia obscura]|uniref:Uncharacterized protein n=1 Tax=Physocladia obscura TaxID=109957 RepID=A0AAD5XCJ3_9FUNG|nr:hypothetical protein HK100_000415 [Physocladia obscura]